MSAATRRDNLNAILTTRFAGKKAEMARALGHDDAYLWQLLRGTRNVGEKVARHIEAKLDLGTGALDTPGMVIAQTLTADELEMLQKYRKASPRWRLSLRLLADLDGQLQDEVSESVNMLMAQIFAKPAADERVAKAYGVPGQGKPQARRLHQPAGTYAKKKT